MEESLAMVNRVLKTRHNIFVEKYNSFENKESSTGREGQIKTQLFPRRGGLYDHFVLGE